MVDKAGKHVQSLHPPAVFSMNHVCIVALLEAACSVDEVFLVHLQKLAIAKKTSSLNASNTVFASHLPAQEVISSLATP